MTKKTKNVDGFSLKKEKKLKWFRTEEFELNDGDILVYRSNKSGKFWSMRCWISEEKKYYVKSLKTKDKEKSIELSKKHYLEIQSKIHNGFQVFDKTLGELCELFLSEQEKRVVVGRVGKGTSGITESRYKTIKTQINRHLLKYINGKTRLSTIKNDVFQHNYMNWRRKIKSQVTDMTILNERSTINSLFKFGYDKKFIQHHQLPIWEKISKTYRTRESLLIGEWREIYNYTRNWSKDIDDRQEIIKREMCRNFILILCNTGLRFGELRYLKWKNVRLIKEKNGDLTSVIDVEISKTGRRQNVIGRSGEYFKRVKKISKFTGMNDWIFVDNNTGEQLGTTTLYRLWKEIIDNTSLRDRIQKYTYYCLRHTYCTFRLMSNTDVFLLSKNMGTSVQHIETVYGHVKMLDKRHFLTTGKVTESDKVFTDI